MIDTLKGMACHAPTESSNEGKTHMYRRRSIRWQDYDYTRGGAYFITICSHAKIHLFGEITNGVMCLSEWGQIVQGCWNAIPEHFPQQASMLLY